MLSNFKRSWEFARETVLFFRLDRPFPGWYSEEKTFWRHNHGELISQAGLSIGSAHPSWAGCHLWPAGGPGRLPQGFPDRGGGPSPCPSRPALPPGTLPGRHPVLRPSLWRQGSPAQAIGSGRGPFPARWPGRPETLLVGSHRRHGGIFVISASCANLSFPV